MKTLRIAPCLFALACSPGPDSSSETHFIGCRRDWECARLGAEFACVDGSCRDVPGGPIPPITPGQCSGEETVCEPPESTALSIPEKRTCALSEGTVAVEWLTELGTVECPLGQCVAANPQLAASGDGGLWAVVDLLMPEPIREFAQLGTGLVRFDASGVRTSATMFSFGSRLTGDESSSGAPAALAEDGDGTLRLLRQSKAPGQFPGSDLEQRSADGALITARRLIDGVRGTTALFGPSDLFAAFLHPPEADAADATPVVSVIRTARDGQLVWQQTGLFSPRLAALDPASGGLWAVHGLSAPGADLAIALLDLAGNIVLNRTVSPDADVGVVSIEPAGDGTVFAKLEISHPPKPGEFGNTPEWPLVLLDTSGAVLWAVELSGEFQSTGKYLQVAGLLPPIDGRAVLAISGLSETTTFLTVSSDGARCAFSNAELGHCLGRDGEDSIYCGVRGFAPSSDAYFVTMPRAIAKVSFGGLP